MSTGNDTAQPAIDHQQQQADPAPSAPAPVADVVQAIVDVDEADLNAAIAEAKAEETPTPPQQEPAPAEPAAPQPSAATGEQPPQVAMIPKPRFDQVLSEVEQLRQERAYLKGQLDARATVAPAAAPAAPPAPVQTPEQRLSAIENATLELAKKFDDGEIPMAEFKREERKLAEQEHAIREEMLLSKVKPAAPAANNDDLYLEAETAKMEQAHPWAFTIDALGEAEAKPIWSFIQHRAEQNLIERGIDPNGGKIGTWHLRSEMAKLTDEYGPVMAGPRAQAKGIALPGTPTPPAQQPQQPKPGPSPQAQARAAALAKQASAPPDITALHGHNGNPGGLPTDGAIEAMSEAEFDALPKATRDRLMGISRA